MFYSKILRMLTETPVITDLGGSEVEQNLKLWESRINNANSP